MLRLLSLLALSSCALSPAPSDPTPHVPEDTEDTERTEPAIPSPVELAPVPLARLTSTQYRNTVLDLLGGPMPAPQLMYDSNPYLFFSIGAASQPLAEADVQHLEEAAQLFAERVMLDEERRAALVGCEPDESSCLAGFVQRFGARAFRRPLASHELDRWIDVATDLSDADGWQAVHLVVAGMLQSPNLIYRPELGTPDADDPTRMKLNDHELASRLSYLVWDTMPDEELFAAAEAGLLSTEEGLAAQLERMLADSRARAAVQGFFAQYLDLGRLEGIQRDEVAYPAFSSTLATAMRTEVQLLVDDLVFRRDTDIREIFSAEHTFVNDALAELYGLEAPGADAITFVRTPLPPDGPRQGILTLGAFLTMNAHEVDTSPTLRGKYVKERVLCALVPPPPADISLELTDDPGQPRTLREKLEEHRNNPACAGCHQLIDPPGMLFEHFDAIGAWRDLDRGYPIDASGDLEGQPMEDARALARALREDERVAPCLTQQLFRHAHGRLDVEADETSLEQITEAFAANDHRFTALLRALVTHESFRYVAKPDGAP